MTNSSNITTVFPSTKIALQSKPLAKNAAALPGLRLSPKYLLSSSTKHSKSYVLAIGKAGRLTREQTRMWLAFNPVFLTLPLKAAILNMSNKSQRMTLPSTLNPIPTPWHTFSGSFSESLPTIEPT